MAARIKAIKALQASIEPDRTAEMQDIVEFMQRHTGLNEGEMWLVFMELRDALVTFGRRGHAGHPPGINGSFRMNVPAQLGEFATHAHAVYVTPPKAAIGGVHSCVTVISSGGAQT